MKITCQQYRDALLPYAAGVLEPGERAVVAEHLRGCAACRAALAEWQAVTIALQTLDAATPSDPQPEARWSAIAARRHQANRIYAPKGRSAMSQQQAPDLPSAAPVAAPERRRPRWAAPIATATLIALAVAGFAVFHLAGRAMPGTAPGGSSAATCPATSKPAALPSFTKLAAVTLAAPNDGWIAGTHYDPTGARPTQGVIYHLQACRWTLAQSLPKVTLVSIAMTSATDGWAAGEQLATGQYAARNHDAAGLALYHFTGGHWQSVTLPGASQLSAGSLTLLSADDGWLTADIGLGANTSGAALFYLHNGAWSPVSVPARIAAFSANAGIVGPDDAWFAGIDQATTDNAEYDNLAHYANGAWTVLPPTTTRVTQFVMRSPTNGWAVGNRDNSLNGTTTSPAAILHFDGAAWTPATIPQPAPQSVTYLNGVSFASDLDGWAIGYAILGGPQIVYYHYAQGQWALTTVNYNQAITGIIGNEAIAVTPTGDGWALGEAAKSDGHQGVVFAGVILHLFNGQWTIDAQS